jgi:hypothetical protein
MHTGCLLVVTMANLSIKRKRKLKRSSCSLFLSASIWSPIFFIPHPAVPSDNITGRRPRLTENDKVKASG